MSHHLTIAVASLLAAAIVSSDPSTASAGDMFPAWSRDGKKIAFTSDRTGHAQLYEIELGGVSQ